MKKKSYLAGPYILWMSLFIVVPLILIVVFSFSVKTGEGLKFSLDNIKRLMDPLYIKVFGRSIKLAVESTILCLLIGYPVAYIISKKPEHRRGILIMLDVYKRQSVCITVNAYRANKIKEEKQ